MKIFLILIIITFSFSDYLYIDENVCVKDLETYKKGYCYKYSSSNDVKSICKNSLRIDDFVANYNYIDGDCFVSDSVKIGISESEYNNQMALAGNLLGFAFLFFVLMIISLS